MSKSKYGINVVIKGNKEENENIDLLLQELTTKLAESQAITRSVRNGRFIQSALKAINSKKVAEVA